MRTKKAKIDEIGQTFEQTEQQHLIGLRGRGEKFFFICQHHFTLEFSFRLWDFLMNSHSYIYIVSIHFICIHFFDPIHFYYKNYCTAFCTFVFVDLREDKTRHTHKRKKLLLRVPCNLALAIQKIGAIAYIQYTSCIYTSPVHMYIVQCTHMP